MNKDIVLGVIRHVLTIVSGLLVAKGITDSGGAETLAGSVVGIIGVVWSIWDKKAVK